MADDNEKISAGDGTSPADETQPQKPQQRPAAPVSEGKPAVPKPPPKKPAAPPKPKGPQKEPWGDALIDAIREAFPTEVAEAYSFLGLRHLCVGKDRITDILTFLRKNAQESFDFLSDETATHWPAEEEFELVYVLFSFETHKRLVVKTRIREWEPIDSATVIWSGADWLEREIYDMFGIRFEGHPNLKRILLPEDWTGFPLRKDYDMRLQDVEWVRKHLGIESGQKFYVGKAKHEEG